MKAPTFWNEKPGLLAWLLSPLGWIYGRITLQRMSKTSQENTLKIPVICVGNFTSGGAGKTPTVALIADLLVAHGEKPFILSRGYGGKLSGPLLIDTASHRSADCGDEPLLLSRHAPTIVSRNRYAGAALAQRSGASVIIMDDGLQNPTVKKDFSIAVIDGDIGVGNGFCVPAGPLRAPLEEQAAHVDLMLWIGGEEDSAKDFLKQFKLEMPLLRGKLIPSSEVISALRNKQLMAFAGIGRPQKFFETLREAGLDLVETRAFPDHHAYSPKEINALRKHATQLGLQLVTTEKDLVRIDQVGDILAVPASLSTQNNRLVSMITEAMRRKYSAISTRAGA